MKSAGKARNNGLYRHIRTSKEIIRNLLNDYYNIMRSIKIKKPGMFWMNGKNVVLYRKYMTTIGITIRKPLKMHMRILTVW